MDYIPQNPRDSIRNLNLSLSDSSDDESLLSNRRLPACRPGVQDPFAFDSDSSRGLGLSLSDSDSDDDRFPALFEDSSDDDGPPPGWNQFNHRPFTTDVDSDSDSETGFSNLPVDFFLSKRDFYHDSPFYDSDSSDD